MHNGKLYLVTGGAGFIGSCFVLAQVKGGRASVVTLDKLTYSGNLHNLDGLENPQETPARHTFVHGDIGDAELVARLLREHQPDAIINFAAETHVDRSIADPAPFVQSNVAALCTLLGTTLEWWKSLDPDKAAAFRFLHISTDEVFGTLKRGDPAFTEQTPYAPNSPYSASKAASDHFARAFYETYGLPVIITNCSNNYGPRQFPEKLIPLAIVNALAGRPIPIYGSGENIRDWLYVEDHCSALELALERGRPGLTYNIGGKSEKNNLEVIHTLCSLLDEARPAPALGPKGYTSLIAHVKDRPGHDFRYAINCGKIERELGWSPALSFEDGLRRTLNWYLENGAWLESVQSGEYRRWLEHNYQNR